MPELIIEYGPVRVVLESAGNHDTLFVMQRGAEAILQQLIQSYGRIAAQGAVPLELYPEKEVRK